MSNNFGGRGYVNELNRIHLTEFDEDFGPFDDSLNLFTSAVFNDGETGTQTDFHGPAKPNSDSPESSKSGEPASATSMMTDFSLEFPSDFNYGDYNYASPTLGNFPESLNLQPIQPNPQGVYPGHAPYGSHNGGQIAQAGEKRKAGEPATPTRPMSFEEASRLAAEEDKRRRNTAASARFRVKKKQREMALEKSAKEMNDKVSALENKISALETENNWLKKLILEKNDGAKDDATTVLDGKSKKSKGETKDEIVAPEPKKLKVDAST